MSRKDWKTKPDLRARARRRPGDLITAGVRPDQPVISRSSVVLPQPDGPSSVTKLLSGMSSETSRSASTRFAAPVLGTTSRPATGRSAGAAASPCGGRGSAATRVSARAGRRRARFRPRPAPRRAPRSRPTRPARGRRQALEVGALVEPVRRCTRSRSRFSPPLTLQLAAKLRRQHLEVLARRRRAAPLAIASTQRAGSRAKSRAASVSARTTPATSSRRAASTASGTTLTFCSTGAACSRRPGRRARAGRPGRAATSRRRSTWWSRPPARRPAPARARCGWPIATKLKASGIDARATAAPHCSACGRGCPPGRWRSCCPSRLSAAWRCRPWRRSGTAAPCSAT